MKRPRVFQSILLQCFIGLVTGYWLASANAQTTYTPLILEHPTPQAFASFGWAVAGVGDVDGDGTPDLLVGAPFQPVGDNTNQGQAFVLSGATGNLLFTLNTPDEAENTLFGAAVAGVGDVDGDGTPDLLVGAPDQTVDGNASQGQAFVLSGFDGSLLHTLNNPTPQADARFGAAVAGVGDVNGDNIPDLLVGADEQDVDGNNSQGQAFVFSGADGSLLHTLNNPTPQASASFGAAVAGVGDVNGDDRSDLLVGAPFQDVDSSEEQGQVVLFVSMISEIIEVTVDILPETINLKTNRWIRVAILTTPAFDATRVDPSSVRFGPVGAQANRMQLKDVDRDGDTDLLLGFRTSETGIACGDTEASLTGQTFAGESISGSDSFVTSGC